MKSKGQVALYAIIGMIVLIAAGVSIYVFTQTTEDALPEVQAATRSDLSKFVQSCVEPAVLEGLEILRLQGGHINLPQGVPLFTYGDPDGFSVQIIDGRPKVVQDGSLVRVPFWVHQDFAAIPSLEYMGDHLEDYVKDETLRCLDDFNFFKEQSYTVTIEDEMEVEAELSGNVVVTITYPVTLTLGNEIISEREFATKLEINLKKPQDFMESLAAREMLDAMLEYRTKKFITLNSGTNPDSLPPMSATRFKFDCQMTTWRVGDVKTKLQDIIMRNIQAIKVIGTDYEPIQATASQAMLDSLLIDLGEGIDYSDLKADFLYYPPFGMDFDILPRMGDVIRPDRTAGAGLPGVGNTCNVKYNFKYYVRYPVLLEVTPKDSDKIDAITKQVEYNGGYTFRVPFLVVIQGNQPREFVPLPDLGFGQEERDEISSLLFLDPGTLDTDFCNNRDSGEVTMTVVDAETSTRLESGTIYYRCGSQSNNCLVGDLENGEFVGKMPQCENGVVTVKNNEYATFETLLTTDEDEKTVNYFLDKIREMKVVVKKIPTKEFINAYRFGTPFTPRDLEINESAIINIRGLEQPTVTYPDVNTTKIGAGSYAVTINLYGVVNVESTDPDTGETSKVRRAGLGTTVVPLVINPGDLIDKEEIVILALQDRTMDDIVNVTTLTKNAFTQGDGGINAYVYNGLLIDYFDVLRFQLESDEVTLIHLGPQDYKELLKPRIR
ncbi:MAG: hypothetical protein QGH47_00070 [Candidatus Woesearchaeota archaeon]|jgi:hypothetical protein|nr:hypothetical protein [Candidatus Woesearchaeota archaeon]